MASPQLEDGYTRIANELLDALIRCCPGFTEGQILLFIIRMTYGWHKKEDFISIGQIGQGVNKSRRMVIYALQNLEAKHMITVKRMRGAGHLNEINAISLNKNHEQWVVQEKAEQYKKVLDNRKLQYKNSKDKVVQEIEGSARNGKGVVQEMVKNVRFLAPSKERKKEEKEIRAELEIPSWISSECFESFKEMRKKIKKPMTKRAEELVIKELGKLKEKGSDPNEVLEQSIRNDWQDVYPIKEKGNGNQKTRSAVDEGLARFLASEDDPEETESLSQTYFSAFKAYKDHEIQEAADDYATSGEYFPPKPAQILNLVKNVDQSKHNRELTEHWTCSMCKQKVSSITSDGVCLDCCGVPMPAYESIKPLPNSTSRHYRMEGRMQCQTCGNVGMCIKEPADSGPWQCRQCYTRMNNKEIVAAFRALGTMVGEDRETGPRNTDPSLH